MSETPEDAGERLQFDCLVKQFGNPLDAIAATLDIWSRMAPPQGSYGKSLAIYSNEVAKAATALASRDARIAALTGALKAVITGWEALPTGFYDKHAIQDWLSGEMHKGIQIARAALALNDEGRTE